MAERSRERQGSVFQDVYRRGTVREEKLRQPGGELREDSEQTQKYNEIIDLLVAAGYFRARIKGLSPFDQVVGGLVWCITICNYSVDVDILFQENSTMGEKLSLVEKIVNILPKMKCPHVIQPHEIQGYNYLAIYPVIQWLVKQVLVYRAEMGDQNRALSIFHFNKRHQVPKSEGELAGIAGRSTVKTLRAESIPQRRFKRVSNKKVKSDQALIQCTLLEFDRKKELVKMMSVDSSGGAGTDNSEAEAALDKMLGSMTSFETKGGAMKSKVSSATVGSLLTQQSDKVNVLQAEFQQMKLEAENTPAQQHARQMKSLKGRIVETEKAFESKAEEYKKLNGVFKETKAVFQQHQAELDAVDARIAELKQAETERDKAMVERLNQLIKQHEKVKQAESAFKAQCKEEIAALNAEIEALKVNLDRQLNDPESVDPETLAHHEDLQRRVTKAEALIGRKTRELASLQRKLDDIPARAELTQYQKRFIELYNQIAFKYTETKHGYALYNVLSDTKEYLEKEITLLNSIHDNFERAMGSVEGKRQFLQYMESANETIGMNKDKVLHKKALEKGQRDQLNSKLLDLIEKQRLYFQTVKDFQEECRINEKYHNRLSALRSK